MAWTTRWHGTRGPAVLAAVALLAAACGSSGGSSKKDAADTTLIAYTGQSSDYQSNFNPYGSAIIGGIGTIFEPLFYSNVLKADPPEPRLGTEYSWNADGTQLSVSLRQGVQWSDGQAFTSRDVVFTLNLLAQHPEMNGIGYDGEATAPDDTHVIVKFKQPAFVRGPQILGRVYIVPEHTWKDLKTPATATIDNPVGTGPYTLTEFKAQAFTYAANPRYWGGEPAVKKVRFLALSGNQSGEQAMRAGQIDWQTNPIPGLKNIEKNYPGYKAIVVPLNQMVLDTCSSVALGCTGPQTDAAVRRAIYYGLNRAQINALAFEDAASEISPGFGLLKRDAATISAKLLDRTAPMQPDVAKAQQLLQGAGYTRTADGIYAKDGRPLALTVKTVSGWADYITAANTMKQQLKQVGIDLTVEQLSWNEWTAQRQGGNFQLIMDSLNQGPAPDPYYLYSNMFGTGGTAKVGGKAVTNWSRFSDPQVDGDLTALTQLDPKNASARQPHLDTIQTRIEQAMPYIPVLTQGTVTEYRAAKFTGWPTEKDMYAFPAVWQTPDNAEVMKRLKPAGK